MNIFKILIMSIGFLTLAVSAQAASVVKTVQLNIDYRILECSYDLIFQYPCSLRTLKSEEVNFVLDQCVDTEKGRFCDSRWAAGAHIVEGFVFKAVVVVQDYLENSGHHETTIYGWMKSGELPDSSEMNFSLFIDSGKLHDPVRVDGVTLAKPKNIQERIFTYTPQLKISPLIK